MQPVHVLMGDLHGRCSVACGQCPDQPEVVVVRHVQLLDRVGDDVAVHLLEHLQVLRRARPDGGDLCDGASASPDQHPSDPQRLRRLASAITTAGERPQAIVLTSNPERFVNLREAHRIEM
ncbi:hypothetical protein AVL61_00860 [Kocuria rosea subsp. polaris]|uniref:Uncharacterized protein n=1 Tax=Kocuria rosea subsp. polaris TaxID=136273 RepID=A0A0W8INI1_KOCRO|nr:hypothetical protein [Kocuria polaris]KUG61509.1 hypothetical protein AVL61_00860 [Kocuria polaris]